MNKKILKAIEEVKNTSRFEVLAMLQVALEMGEINALSDKEEVKLLSKVKRVIMLENMVEELCNEIAIEIAYAGK